MKQWCSLGFSLLEVLITLLILSLGLLGFARAEILALQINETAYFQSIATIQLNGITDAIRACNNMSTAPANCFSEATKIWKAENKILLPQAESNYRKTSTGYTLTIRWKSPVANGSTTASIIL
jgi:type IV pilus assembly protein PilV